MANFQPADNLRSRTFLGLLVAQFLAAFNDQAIHASSMFFAINQNALSKDFAISLMPILRLLRRAARIAASFSRFERSAPEKPGVCFASVSSVTLASSGLPFA